MAITLLQSNNAGPTTGASLAVEYATQAVTAGSLLVAEVRYNNTGEIVSDNINGDWTQAVGNGFGGYNASIWFFQNSAPGTVTVTLSGGASGPRQMNIQEWSQIAITGALDQVNSATGAGTASSSGNVTTTALNELIIGCVTATTDITGPGAGFTADLNSPTLLAEYKIVSTTGTYAATGVQSADVDWTALVATFQAAAGAVIAWVS
jgi:hypothetical protein